MVIRARELILVSKVGPCRCAMVQYATFELPSVFFLGGPKNRGSALTPKTGKRGTSPGKRETFLFSPQWFLHCPIWLLFAPWGKSGTV